MSERESRYSQPKLELFGLYRALKHWRLYIIGVKNLEVEVNAKFIQGLLNNPDLQPDAAVNRWIQGILMFHFSLKHVPATKFQGPGALSRRGLAEGEIAEEDDDSWLDAIALYAQEMAENINRVDSSWMDSLVLYAQEIVEAQRVREIVDLPSCHLARKVQEQNLRDIEHFLRTLEAPTFLTSQKHRRFIRQATQYMVKGKKLFKRNGNGPPLMVILEP